jgi:CDP-paratose 2-epimerase
MTRADDGFPATDARPILVTGGAGFIGSNLVDRMARDGHRVHVYDCLARKGVEGNLAWLQQRHPDHVSFTRADMRDRNLLTEAACGAKAVFHLAAQVAVTTSLMNPREDFEINVQGTFDLVDALRDRPVPLIMASTNKVYGDRCARVASTRRDRSIFIRLTAARRARRINMCWMRRGASGFLPRFCA